jgi:hypothetical protein
MCGVGEGSPTRRWLRGKTRGWQSHPRGSPVITAQAGIQNATTLDSRLRGNDGQCGVEPLLSIPGVGPQVGNNRTACRLLGTGARRTSVRLICPRQSPPVQGRPRKNPCRALHGRCDLNTAQSSYQGALPAIAPSRQSKSSPTFASACSKPDNPVRLVMPMKVDGREGIYGAHPSLPRRRESRMQRRWIPACAGMTVNAGSSRC